MNSTLQVLSNTITLTNYFLKEFNYNPNDPNKKLSNEYYKVLINLRDKNKKKGSYSPNDFKKILGKENPLFAGTEANDSKDLINFLLERFHSELNNRDNQQIKNNYYKSINQLDETETLCKFLQDFKNNYSSIISDCFYGVLETKNQCSICKTLKFNFQIYSFLEFPLEQVNIYCFQTGRRASLENKDGSKPDVDLLECFDYYQKIDLMSGSNQMYCNTCNENTDAYYNTSIYSLPLYLIINLNRGKNAVYQCKVNFPEQLNLLNYVSYKSGVTTLNLYAVICHYGPSSMDGHFIAYCHNQKDNNWYSYNDAFVSLCNKPKAYNDGMPYILFYKAV
jgi:ubiquitin C-terminal hydrolase